MTETNINNINLRELFDAGVQYIPNGAFVGKGDGKVTNSELFNVILKLHTKDIKIKIESEDDIRKLLESSGLKIEVSDQDIKDAFETHQSLNTLPERIKNSPPPPKKEPEPEIPSKQFKTPQELQNEAMRRINESLKNNGEGLENTFKGLDVFVDDSKCIENPSIPNSKPCGKAATSRTK